MCTFILWNGSKLWSWLSMLIVAALLLILAGGNPIQAREQSSEIGAEAGPAIDAAQPSAGVYSLFFPRISHERQLNSFDLIDQAQARGEINDETALIYKIFATFADPRLPWRLRGDNSGVIDSTAIGDALRRYDALSPPTQALLAPFLVPPVYEGSWYDLRRRGFNGRTGNEPLAPLRRQDLITDLCQKVAKESFLSITSTHFRVWYPPGSASLAQDAQTALEQLEQRIHPTMTTLFNMQPKSDAGLGCNPGDDRLDVYIVYGAFPSDFEGTLAAVAVYPTEDCKDAATYMLVLSRDFESLSVIVHEFTHMIQRAYKLTGPVGDCLDDDYESWWLEATADWAMDAFEEIDPAPDRNFEHTSALSYLETAVQNLWSWGDNREYGAYLLPFYLVRRLEPDRPQLIPDIFADMTKPGGESLYSVIEARVDGGLAERWPEFALYNLNLPPNDDYEQWDDITLRWDDWKTWQAHKTDMELKGQPQLRLALGLYGPTTYFILPDLAADHMDVRLANDVRLFAFANTFAGKPDVRVQALGREAGGEWQGPFDWTPRKWNILCRDQAAQRYDEVIILLTNSDWKDTSSPAKSDGPLKFVGSNLGCDRWQGTSAWRLQGQSHEADSELTYTLSANAQITFGLTNSRVTGDTVGFEFQAVAGSVNWSHVIDGKNLQTGQTVHCERAGVKPLSDIAGMLAVGETLTDDPPDRQFFGAGVAHLNPAELCPDTADLGWANQPWLQTGDDFSPWTGNDGGRLQGSVSKTVIGDTFSHTETSSWDFSARPNRP